MTDILRIKRRLTGSPGAPVSLANAELAFNEVDNTLYYGQGTGGGGGTATAVIGIGGAGAFTDLSSNQTIGGTKTFTGQVLASGVTNFTVPTVAALDSSTKAASTAWVNGFAQPKNNLLTSLAGLVTNGILVQTSSGVSNARTLTGTVGRITVTSGDGVAGNPTFDLNTITFTAGAAGTAYPKITFDAYGRVTAGQPLLLADIPVGVALLVGATFTGATIGLTPAQYNNSTNFATTAWVGVSGLRVSPTITNFSTTPQTLANTLGGSLVLYSGSTPGSFTLPAANSPTAGTGLIISNISAQNLTIAPAGADTLDEGVTPTLRPGERIGLVADGVNMWRTLWRVNYANPSFTGNVAITGSLTVTGATAFNGGITGTTLNLTASIAQNFIFAGPPSAGAGAPSFRALVPADLPLATAIVAGAVIIGTGLTVVAGTISANVVSVATLTGTITAANLSTQLLAAGTIAPLASPTFTGVPAAPNPANGISSTQIATTAFVLATRLDQLTAPTADVSFNNRKITGLLDPTNPQDAATKNYVDINLQGLTPKQSAIAATSGPLPANTYNNGAAGVGAILTATANGALTVDGVAISVIGQVVLVKNEVAAANNGLYVLSQIGDVTHPYILIRHTDMDVANQVLGAFIPVESGGTLNGNSLWLCNPVGAITIGTTALPFTELNKAADLLAGNGIGISGNTISAVGTANRIVISSPGIDIAATYVGQASITTLGTISTGSWQGATIGAAYGGTGAATLTGYIKGNGVAAFTASATIPNTDITGLGTMSTQAASAVAVTGGTIDGVTFDMGTF